MQPRGTPNALIRLVSGLLAGRTYQSFGPDANSQKEKDAATSTRLLFLPARSQTASKGITRTIHHFHFSSGRDVP